MIVFVDTCKKIDTIDRSCELFRFTFGVTIDQVCLNVIEARSILVANIVYVPNNF